MAWKVGSLWLKKSVWEFWSLYEKCLRGNTSTALFVFTVTLDSKVKLAAKFLEVRHCFMFLSRSINCKAKKENPLKPFRFNGFLQRTVKTDISIKIKKRREAAIPNHNPAQRL